MTWTRCGGQYVQQLIFEHGKVGHVLKLEREWLAVYDGQIVGRKCSELTAKAAVEQRGTL